MANACSHCHAPIGRDGHDPCIRNLPGVVFACCGHGGKTRDGKATQIDHCYVAFDDGLTVYGNVARWAMRMLGGQPPESSVPTSCATVAEILAGTDKGSPVWMYD